MTTSYKQCMEELIKSGEISCGVCRSFRMHGKIASCPLTHNRVSQGVVNATHVLKRMHQTALKCKHFDSMNEYEVPSPQMQEQGN